MTVWHAAGVAIDPKLVRAEELGIRLEIVRGLPIWEAAPTWRHQREVDRVRASIRPREGTTCHCVHAADIYVQFPDGSLQGRREAPRLAPAHRPRVRVHLHGVSGQWPCSRLRPGWVSSPGSWRGLRVRKVPSAPGIESSVSRS